MRKQHELFESYVVRLSENLFRTRDLATSVFWVAIPTKNIAYVMGNNSNAKL